MARVCEWIRLGLIGAILMGGCNSKRGSSAPGESADELYKRGRAIEDRTAANPTEAQANLRAARDSYTRGLAATTSKQLDAYIRTSLANVDYFLDDYPAALEQWTTAYPNLTDKEMKAWTLYRIGLCEQRLGRFSQADQEFDRVQSEYAGTLPAQRAKEKHGIHQFHVQLATYDSTTTAQAAAAALKKDGMPASLTVDAQGRHQLRLGPYGSYAEARGAKGRLGERFGDAFIVP